MPLFVKDEDLIPITVYYRSGKTSTGRRYTKVIEEKDALIMLQDPIKAKKVEKLNVKFREPTWATQQKTFSQSSVYNPASGKRETEWTIFSDIELKSNMVDWDATDDDGRKLPITPELIDSLPAPIANELLSRYRKIMAIEDGEMGE